MGEGRHGHCRCGAARLTARVLKDHADACHCSMCRRFMIFRSSDWAEPISCARCGRALAWRMVDGAMANVPPSVFDPPLDRPLGMEIFIDEKPAGYAFAGDALKMTGVQVAAAFAGKEA